MDRAHRPFRTLSMRSPIPRFIDTSWNVPLRRNGWRELSSFRLKISLNLRSAAGLRPSPADFPIDPPSAFLRIVDSRIMARYRSLFLRLRIISISLTAIFAPPVTAASVWRQIFGLFLLIRWRFTAHWLPLIPLPDRH